MSSLLPWYGVLIVAGKERIVANIQSKGEPRHAMMVRRDGHMTSIVTQYKPFDAIPVTITGVSRLYAFH